MDGNLLLKVVNKYSLKARPHWHSDNDLGPSQNVFALPHCNRQVDLLTKSTSSQGVSICDFVRKQNDFGKMHALL